MNEYNYSSYFKNLLENNRAAKKQIAVYLDDTMLSRVDTVVKAFSSSGKNFTRNAIIEEAIELFLTEAEKFIAESIKLNDDVLREKNPPTNLMPKIKALNTIEELRNLYDNQPMSGTERKKALEEDEGNNVRFFALTETRAIHEDNLKADLSNRHGRSLAYYVPEHGLYIARGGYTSLAGRACVVQTLNGKAFDPENEVPITDAKLAV